MNMRYSELERLYKNVVVQNQKLVEQLEAVKEQQKITRCKLQEAEEREILKELEAAHNEIIKRFKEIDELHEVLRQQDNIIACYQQWFGDRSHVTHTHKLPEFKEPFTALDPQQPKE